MKLAKGAIIGLEVHNKLLRVRWQAVANNALWNKALNAAPNTVMLLSYPITGSAKSACCTLLNVQQLVAAGAPWQPWWMKCHIAAPALSDLPCFLIYWLQEGMSEWVVAYKQVAPCEVLTVTVMPRGNLEYPILLKDCERKPEYPTQIHTYMGRVYKLPPEGPCAEICTWIFLLRTRPSHPAWKTNWMGPSWLSPIGPTFSKVDLLCTFLTL